MAVFNDLWAKGEVSDRPRLRFSLGGGHDEVGEVIPRFLQALARASAIADFIFDDECVGIAAFAEGQARLSSLDEHIGFDGFAATGFRAPILTAWQDDLYGSSDGPPWTVRTYDLSLNKPQRDVLLWHSVARELPIEPKSGVVTFLLQPRRGVLLHVYDDRGMDLTASDPRELLAAYKRFDNWLLDYDRTRMAQIFEVQ